MNICLHFNGLAGVFEIPQGFHIKYQCQASQWQDCQCPEVQADDLSLIYSYLSDSFRWFEGCWTVWQRCEGDDRHVWCGSRHSADGSLSLWGFCQVFMELIVSLHSIMYRYLYGNKETGTWNLHKTCQSRWLSPLGFFFFADWCCCTGNLHSEMGHPVNSSALMALA